MRSKMLGLVAMCLLACTFAAAQATRTWVSGNGNDADPCSRLSPCKTLAGAISKTAAGGEIDVLDPGGYGALTITKAITIDGGGGQVASVLASGTNAIIVQAGVSDRVILRNLRINGAGGATGGMGINGIDYRTGGTLIVENCDLMNFTTNGIFVESASNGHLIVRNTTVTNAGSAGIRVQAGMATIEDSNLSANVHGLAVFTSKVTAVRTVAAQNSTNGFVATSGELNLADCTAANNAYGVNSGAILRMSNVTVTDNTQGLAIFGVGQVISWGNNHIAGNTSSIAPTSTIAPQ